MEIMIHLRQKDTPLDLRKYTGLSLLLADAVEYYQKIGFAKYVGTALNPTMDTFVLVEAVSVDVVTQLIDRIAQVKEIRAFLGPEEGVADYIDVRIMPMIAGGSHAAGKAGGTIGETCRRLKEAIDSGLLDVGTLNDAKEQFKLLKCDEVLDPLGGGGFDGGITPGGGWPDPGGGLPV